MGTDTANSLLSKVFLFYTAVFVYIDVYTIRLIAQRWEGPNQDFWIDERGWCRMCNRWEKGSIVTKSQFIPYFKRIITC